jgi:predicted PurR-regulated permease PerM
MLLPISVSVAAGAELGGVVGALLAIPAAGALKVVFAELADWRRARRPDAGATAQTTQPITLSADAAGAGGDGR